MGHLICDSSKRGNANKNLSHDAQIPKQKQKASYKNQYITAEGIVVVVAGSIGIPRQHD
ncbi:MAG TPA: hypothetical protein V6D04_12715 [Candidatus Obscuribacterales bacterium]